MYRILFAIFIAAQASMVSSSPFDVYKDCQTYIEAGNTTEIKNAAVAIAQLPSSQIELQELGVSCLAQAYGSDWLYNSNFGVFVSADRQALSLLEEDLRAIGDKKTTLLAKKIENAFSDTFEQIFRGQLESLTKQLNELRDEKECAMLELDRLMSNRDSIAEGLKNQNTQLVEDRTYDACKKLHLSEPDVAILNPICRQAFLNGFHPDLDLSSASDDYQQLNLNIREQRQVVQKFNAPLLNLIDKVREIRIELGEIVLQDNTDKTLTDCSRFD